VCGDPVGGLSARIRLGWVGYLASLDMLVILLRKEETGNLGRSEQIHD